MCLGLENQFDPLAGHVGGQTKEVAGAVDTLVTATKVGLMKGLREARRKTPCSFTLPPKAQREAT